MQKFQARTTRKYSSRLRIRFVFVNKHIFRNVECSVLVSYCIEYILGRIFTAVNFSKPTRSILNLLNIKHPIDNHITIKVRRLRIFHFKTPLTIIYNIIADWL